MFGFALKTSQASTWTADIHVRIKTTYVAASATSSVT